MGIGNFDYRIEDSDTIITPALIYYTDLIEEHIGRIISMAGGPQRLWPHMKSHKTAELLHMMQNHGITKVKCATIAEAELAASCGMEHVFLAYPLVGPNIKRFLDLEEAFPGTVFWACGEHEGSLVKLGEESTRREKRVNVLVDVDMGMHRTGVCLNQVVDFWKSCRHIPGLELKGLHCYDGNRHEHDGAERLSLAKKDDEKIEEIKRRLRREGYPCETIIIGGSPSFPCHLSMEDAYYSPGTIFINDYGYTRDYQDLEFTPAAVVLTRVISCPGAGRFTLDLGYKAIASDPPSPRGKLVGMEHIRELFQNEEHWAFQMEPGYERQCPDVGDVVYVIPTHICPTSALYPSVLTASGGRITGNWDVAARNRKITY